ncbi:hypothetical protein B0H15DRAFT_766409 [Mycena belliarum]|uniref:Uncharacterized protein n=1 Tax=Mycena belliarum TaxID=1033014 RepID=A0AAD6UL80_9AGAR|nr:hypothetical protein B0H15DRAFT_766409 [Mycena belliae]
MPDASIQAVGTEPSATRPLGTSRGASLTPSSSALTTNTLATSAPAATLVSTPPPVVPPCSETPPVAPLRSPPPVTQPVVPPRSETPPVAPLRSPPPKAPAWFVNARTVLTKVDLGLDFDALIAAWTRIEYASRFEQGPTNLSPTGRPKQIATWIAGRRAHAPPKVTDTGAYASQWKVWWDSLQPKWRKRDKEGMWATDEYGDGGAEWGPLYQWGVNGTLSLLAALHCWGSTVLETGQPADAWEAAVMDVTWMLEGMAIYYEKFNRRF